MYKVLVFAGTTEGYELCRFLGKQKISVCALVATEYGTRSPGELPGVALHAGRMDESQMEAFIQETSPELVLDATHPYAAEVTKNIREACDNKNTEYVRILRAQGKHEDQAVYTESIQDAVEYLKGTRGNILLTTGSKELLAFTGLPDYRERVYARVLSLPSVISACKEMGFEGKHLIGMQGPFSRELNEAMLRQFQCDFLVTKDTGMAGGFQEKIDAALNCHAVPVIIGRPIKEQGLTVLECKRFLQKRFQILAKPKVTVLGIGMGSEETLTIQGKRAVQEADLVIGARRMADSVGMPGQKVVYEYRSEAILKYIEEHPEFENILIVLSGDVGFYSGAKKLLEGLGSDTQVICGISSVVYFMSRIHMSWEDAKLLSAHGKNCNLIHYICHYRKVFAILGSGREIGNLAAKLVSYGMSDVMLYVGEKLSYPEEKIFAKTAGELIGYEGDALCVVCACNPKAKPMLLVHGIRDEEFIRGKAPMTKEEIRTVSLSKLQLPKDAICYDVGAGTGSLSVEMALRAFDGEVYAIEKKDEAAELIHENKMKFAADNLEVIKGEAPEALKSLPAPTHVFIGGSSGNLSQIVDLLMEKNPEVRIVINCITLETVGEALQVIKNQQFTETDIVQISAARSKEIGRYHMMMGENPIYIITCQKREEKK